MPRKKKPTPIAERLRHGAMHKRTFTISQSLHARMERFPDVNWSAVIRELLEEFVADLEA